MKRAAQTAPCAVFRGDEIMENKMFCWQCQETAGNKGCTQSGVCGKDPKTAGVQDLLIYVTKGICRSDGAACRRKNGEQGNQPFGYAKSFYDDYEREL